jgi:prepilin-type N-terminal cleavage/methylation domain-containing protein
MYNFKKAFTLIELLLVIAIISILAGVIMVKVSSSSNQSKTVAALQTMRSTLPYATECYMKSANLNTNPAPTPSVTTICSITNTTFPDLNTAKTGYSYNLVAPGANYSSTNATIGHTITCDAAAATCTVT